MPQSQIIRLPADVSDLQATGGLNTSEPSASDECHSVIHQSQIETDDRPISGGRIFPSSGWQPADDRTVTGSFCNIVRRPD
ncbi:hypothetical protein DPMN_139244 [Dreissena polymorpha]|uniref:Uncharacterized protein n=1 Tax=Dreissena polymorpha TaxID=45954 RepID=A0A9D4JFH0_DREPO|nr:hypothetical protein DPMN_139244 [Dreissena polymorpha]